MLLLIILILLLLGSFPRLGFEYNQNWGNGPTGLIGLLLVILLILILLGHVPL